MQMTNIAYLNAINPTPVLSRYNKPKRKVKFNLISYADCFFFYFFCENITLGKQNRIPPFSPCYK